MKVNEIFTATVVFLVILTLFTSPVSGGAIENSSKDCKNSNPQEQIATISEYNSTYIQIEYPDGYNLNTVNFYQESISDVIKIDNNNSESPMVLYTYKNTSINTNERGEAQRFPFHITNQYFLAPLPESQNIKYEIKEEGGISNGKVLIGNTTTYEVERECSSIKLLVPDSVSPESDPERTISLLDDVDAEFNIREQKPNITGIVINRDIELNGVTQGNTFVIDENVELSKHTPYNTWIHEYIHTQQNFSPSNPRSDWVTEGMARYYEMRMAYEVGFISRDTFEIGLLKTRRAIDEDSVLSDKSTWNKQTAYVRGATVLAALDSKIRTDTENRTLEHIFLSVKGNNINRDLLLKSTEHYTDEEYNSWLKTYADTESLPDRQTTFSNTISVSGLLTYAHLPTPFLILSSILLLIVILLRNQRELRQVLLN